MERWHQCYLLPFLYLFTYLFTLPFLMPFFLSHARLRSAHASTAQTAVVLQSNYELGTCSKSLHSNHLGPRSNPYSPRYRRTTLTNRQMCLRTIMGEQLVQGQLKSTSRHHTIKHGVHGKHVVERADLKQ